MSRIRVHVHGAGGRMGRACVAAVGAASDMELVGTSGRDDDLAATLARTRPEVLVEFTIGSAARRSLATAAAAGCHAVSGTTGVPVAEVHDLAARFAAAERGLLLAPNFALGVILLQRFARQAVAWFPDVEIVELHHDKKLDAPSGTALATAQQIAAAVAGGCNPGRGAGHESVAGVRGGAVGGIPIHSVRLPGLLAHQEVMFGGPGQLLTLRHDTTDRAAFMPGVLLGVRAIRTRVGLVGSLEDVLP